MRRMRILLLGKCVPVLINKPSVELEDEESCKWEHAAQETTEMEISVVTKNVTEDFSVTEMPIDLNENENLSVLEQVELDMSKDILPEYTDKDIFEAKKSSCSYQVYILPGPKTKQYFEIWSSHQDKN